MSEDIQQGPGQQAQEPELDSEQQQAVQAIYEHAAKLIKAGKSPAQVRADLEQRGLDAESAAVVTANLLEYRNKALKEAATKNMTYGALWCVGGIAVTAITYRAASGGGTYVVAWGAIVFGALQFLHGLIQSFRV